MVPTMRMGGPSGKVLKHGAIARDWHPCTCKGNQLGPREFLHHDMGPYAASANGFSTTLMQFSALSRKIL